VAEVTRELVLQFRPDAGEYRDLQGVEVVYEGRTLAWWSPAHGLTHDLQDWPLLLGKLGELCCAAFVQFQDDEGG
jgi:hypothetical protein